MSLRIEALPDEPNTQAILYGPLVLAGDFGKSDLTPEMTEGSMGPKLTNSAIDIPQLRANFRNDLTSSIRRNDGSLSFRTVGQQHNVDFQPFYKVIGNRYTVYWTVLPS